MNRNNTAMVIIDEQVDFMDLPGSALPVPNAVKDADKLCAFIAKTNPGKIFSSLDTHSALDISHPAWWIDGKGKQVSPFTLIMADDIRNGKYNAVIDPAGSLKYVEDLEANGEFNHFIWPYHCLQGSVGQSLLPQVFEAFRDWTIKNKRWIAFIQKGANPYTEHFGIFRANVPHPQDPSTNVNQAIFKTLNDMDEIYLAGQARSHCVANSLKQLLEIAPQLAPKLVVLTDCMSDVAGLPTDFYTEMNKIYDNALKQGVRTAKSTDI